MAEPTTTDILNQERRDIELSEDIGIAEHEAKIKARDNDFGFPTKKENQEFKDGWDEHNNEQMEIARQEDEINGSLKDLVGVQNKIVEPEKNGNYLGILGVIEDGVIPLQSKDRVTYHLADNITNIDKSVDIDDLLNSFSGAVMSFEYKDRKLEMVYHEDINRGIFEQNEKPSDKNHKISLADKSIFEISDKLNLKENDPSLNEFVNSKLKALSAERKVEAQLFKIGYEPINLLDLSKKESQRIEAIKIFDKAPRDFVKNSNILSTKAERLIESTVKQRHAEIGLNDLLENSSIKNIDTYKEAWTSDLKTENSNLQVAKEELSFYSKWQQGAVKAPLLSTVEEKMNKDNLSLNNQEQILSKMKDKINSEKSISSDKPPPVKEDEMER